jgi:hypothetical protein
VLGPEAPGHAGGSLRTSTQLISEYDSPGTFRVDVRTNAQRRRRLKVGRVLVLDDPSATHGRRVIENKQSSRYRSITHRVLSW